MACWRRTRTKSGKYGPRELCSESYMSLGRLYVPREVDLADRTRGAQRPESCPPGQPPEGRIASLGTYRILNRVPAGRIFSTGRALGRDLCDKDFVLVRLQQANMSYMPLSRFTGSAECCSTGSVSILCIYMSQGSLCIYTPQGQYRIYMYLYVPREPLQANMA